MGSAHPMTPTTPSSPAKGRDCPEKYHGNPCVHPAGHPGYHDDGLFLWGAEPADACRVVSGCIMGAGHLGYCEFVEAAPPKRRGGRYRRARIRASIQRARRDNYWLDGLTNEEGAWL